MSELKKLKKLKELKMVKPRPELDYQGTDNTRLLRFFNSFNFFNSLNFFTVIAAALLWCGAAGGTCAADLPNVVLVVADDLGWNDVGFHGSEICTPRLDALARESVLLNRFYVFPTCSPTRAALLTGRNPNRFGILGPLGLDPQTSLPLETITLAEFLRDTGYVTALVGKWHLGPTFEFGPRRQGFDFAYGYLHGQIDQYKHHYKNLAKSWFRDEAFVDEPGHATDLLAREAAEFMERSRDRPFFLYLCFSVPHYPLQEDAEWLEPYKATIDHTDRRLFAGMVAHMDAAIGRVLDTLDRLRLRRNTLVLFTSDNGGQENWLETSYGGEHGPNQRLGDNRPLRGWKGDVYEGGIRVPAMLHWQGHLGSATFDQVACATDVLPTIAGVIGKEPPSIGDLDGINIWPALSGDARLGDRTLYWNTGSQRAIRAGDWKLVLSRRSNECELFDVGSDPLEQCDRSADEPARVVRLREQLDGLIARDRRR